MSNKPLISAGEIVVLKPDSSTGLSALSGSGQINIPGADLTKGVRLLGMPAYTIDVPYDISRPSTPGIGNAVINPVVCTLAVDESAVSAFKCVCAGTNLGNVSIFQLTTTGNALQVLTHVVLSNTILGEIDISFDLNRDKETGEGLEASYTLICNVITQVTNATDQDGNRTGVAGAQITAATPESDQVAT
jgi:hypothetical protein